MLTAINTKLLFTIVALLSTIAGYEVYNHQTLVALQKTETARAAAEANRLTLEQSIKNENDKFQKGVAAARKKQSTAWTDGEKVFKGYRLP